MKNLKLYFPLILSCICLAISTMGLIREIKCYIEMDKRPYIPINCLTGRLVLDKEIEVKKETINYVIYLSKEGSTEREAIRVYKHEFDQVEIGKEIK